MPSRRRCKQSTNMCPIFLPEPVQLTCNSVTFTLCQHSGAKVPRNMIFFKKHALSSRFILPFWGWTFVNFPREFCSNLTELFLNPSTKLHLGNSSSLERQHTPFSEYPVTGEVPGVCGLSKAHLPQLDWNQKILLRWCSQVHFQVIVAGEPSW